MVRPKVLGDVVQAKGKQLRFAGLGGGVVPVESTKAPHDLVSDVSGDAGEWAFGLGRVAHEPGMNEELELVDALTQVERMPDVGDPFSGHRHFVQSRAPASDGIDHAQESRGCVRSLAEATAKDAGAQRIDDMAAE